MMTRLLALTTNKKFLPVLLLAILSCGPNRSNRVIPPNVLQQNNISFDSRISPARQILIRESLKIHLGTFEIDFGKSQYVNLHIVAERSLYCGGPGASGCFAPPDQMSLVAGDYLETPSFYHELWHLNTPGWDPLHSKNDWVKITLRGIEINNLIRSQRVVLPQ